MKNSEVFYKSDNGKYRVVYCVWDLGDKYKLQKKENGIWRHMQSYASPISALTAMKKAAKEW